MAFPNADEVSSQDWSRIRLELIARLITAGDNINGAPEPSQVLLAEEQVEGLRRSQTVRLARLGTAPDFEPSSTREILATRRLATGSIVGRRFVNSLAADGRLVADLARQGSNSASIAFAEYLAWMVSMAGESLAKRRHPFPDVLGGPSAMRDALGMPLGAMATHERTSTERHPGGTAGATASWVDSQLRPELARAGAASDDLVAWSDSVIRAGATRLRELSGLTRDAEN